MNERIKQLAEQMGWEEMGADLYGKSMDGCMTIHALEKFAELIVRECISIIEPTSHHKAFAQGYLGDVDGLELLDNKVKKIKEHFGVEE